MSISKDRWCDCCGKLIPYDSSKIYMEYSNYTAHCMEYTADNEGNKDCCYHNPKDKIYGMVTFHMHRSPEETTVTPVVNKLDGSQCLDICSDCKIKFLKKTIEYIRKFEMKK